MNKGIKSAAVELTAALRELDAVFQLDLDDKKSIITAALDGAGKANALAVALVELAGETRKNVWEARRKANE